jgi:hypothetical protein
MGLDPGSRNDDWDETRNDPQISGAWAELSGGYTWKCQATVDFDIDTIIDDVSKAVGVAATVIALF